MQRQYRPFALGFVQAGKLRDLLVAAGMSNIKVDCLPRYRGYVLAYQPGSCTMYLTDPADVLEILPCLVLFPPSATMGVN